MNDRFKTLMKILYGNKYTIIDDKITNFMFMDLLLIRFIMKDYIHKRINNIL